MKEKANTGIERLRGRVENLLADRTQRWVESYLYQARGHRALEQSVLAAGERRGYSDRRLLKACQSVAVRSAPGCWELDPVRVTSLVQRELAALNARSVPQSSPLLRPRVLGLSDPA